MSSRTLLRWLLLVQALAALGIGAAGMHWLGMNGWQAAALGLGSVALVRLLINTNNFLMAARAASPTPPDYRVTPGAALKMLWEEFSTSMLMTSWHMPRARAHTRIHPGSTAPPVLLVHGYGCNSGYWAHLAPRLDAARISHATLDLEPLTGDIDGYAARIEEAAQQLRAQAGAAQLIVVAHSMGGLAARAWMRTHGVERVARLITLGTPHHGTCLAAFGLGINAGQMRRMGVAGPECAWLNALAGGEAPEVRARIVSLYSHHDNIIAPQTSSELPGARNLALGGVGHVALGRNPRVLAMVMGEIEAVRSDRAATAAAHHHH
ncbi:esterase/lipase family protein [Massilia arenae]|uniref:Alpha/beta fold hydrolase n=1 Tax=Massilia arenae TaxID=2603288 RepID=A0A5C7G3F0_9BURK|nr:alpha/beta fold hydrolase [Massilia arenae]TXF97377.1 alpha/beta fold hydrolase [Massilia arenae]